jgi:hypothetical protein
VDVLNAYLNIVFTSLLCGNDSGSVRQGPSCRAKLNLANFAKCGTVSKPFIKHGGSSPLMHDHSSTFLSVLESGSITA